MSALGNVVGRLRLGSASGPGLRAPHPPVAIEIGPQEIVLARLKRKSGRLAVDALDVRPLPEAPLASSPRAHAEELAARAREAFQASGIRPGKLSVVLPDNLAKIALVQLPEAPSSRKQLSEMVRFKLRKAIPYRIEDAAISYQLLPATDGEAVVLVAVMQRSIVDQYERLVASLGGRPGSIGLCTPNLYNLCRAKLHEGAAEAGDVALLNCTPTYFSLLIVRGERLIFYRCKPLTVGEDGTAADGVMLRELSTSFSYHQEKLAGTGIRAAFVRSSARPAAELAGMLERLGVERVASFDLASFVDLPPGISSDPAAAQRVAPAVAAAWEPLMQPRPIELNFATRPFRNNTLLWIGHALLAAGVIGFTAWNTTTFLDTGKKLGELRNDVGSIDSRIRDVERREQTAQTAIAKFDVHYLATQTYLANDVIERRALSWTRLFNLLEKVQPYEVRMVTIRPVFGKAAAAGKRVMPAAKRPDEEVPVTVEGTARDLSAFLALERALIADSHFDRVEPERSTLTKSGELNFTLEFLYFPEGLSGKETQEAKEAPSPDEPSQEDAGPAQDEGEADGAQAEQAPTERVKKRGKP